MANMLLAAFTAGATVLVVVNFGAYFIAQQRLQDERKNLESDVIRTAKELDLERDQQLRAFINGESERVNSSLFESQKSISTLDQSIDSLRNSMLQDLKRLTIETWRTATQQAEANVQHLRAAELYSKIVVAEQGLEWVSSLSLLENVPLILRNFDRADFTGYLSRPMLEPIKEALTLASNDPSSLMGVETQHVADTLARVDKIWEQLPEIPEPPPLPPELPPQS